MVSLPFAEKIQCKAEQILPKNTACYQVEDGTFFLFKSEAPYELSAVVNERKVEAKLPAIKDLLTCAGVDRNALYFYSTPPRRLSYKFYRATIDEETGQLQFDKINEIRPDTTSLHFAHTQPFYVRDDERTLLMKFNENENRLNAGRNIFYIKEDAVFFKHLDAIFQLSRGDLAVHYSMFDANDVHIKVPDPEKTAILSCQQNQFLFLISGSQLLVFFLKKPVMQFELHRAPSKQRQLTSYPLIVGMYAGMMILHASRDSEDELWSLAIDENRLSNYGREKIGTGGRKEKSVNRANLAMLLNQDKQADIPPEPATAINPTEKKLPTSTGKINLTAPGGKRNHELAAFKVGTLKKAASLNAVANGIENIQLSPETSGTTFISEFRSKYKPVRVLGRGTFGCVFDVEFKLIEARYAVKRIHLRERGVNKALNEVRAMNRFDHPGIVRFYDVWMEKPPEGWQRESDRQLFKELRYDELFSYKDDCAFLYIKMELCESTLSDWLRNNGHRDLIKMKSWFKQLVSAVGYIHEKNFIHRDLKPSNILFASADRLKICDMGIITEFAYDGSHECTKTRTNAGTEMYMAPEQFQLLSRYSSKVDIFALGLIFAQLCVAMTFAEAIEAFDNYRRGRATAVLNTLPEVKKFVALLTAVKDSRRPTCAEILHHSFLA